MVQLEQDMVARRPKKNNRKLDHELSGKQTVSNCCSSCTTVQKLGSSQWSCSKFCQQDQQVLQEPWSENRSSHVMSWCPQHRLNPLALAFSKPAPTQNRKGSAAFVDSSRFATVQFRRDIKEVRRPRHDSERYKWAHQMLEASCACLMSAQW